MKKLPIIHLGANTSFDRVLGYTIYLDDIEIHYVSGPKRNAVALITRLKKATVQP